MEIGSKLSTKAIRVAMAFTTGVTYVLGTGCTPVSSAPEQEHHTVNVVACTETGFVDQKCDSNTDKPLEVEVNIRDIQGNAIMSARTVNGVRTFEFVTSPGKILDLGYPDQIPDPSGNGYLCPSPTVIVNQSSVDATLAYSNCQKPQLPIG